MTVYLLQDVDIPSWGEAQPRRKWVLVEGGTRYLWDEDYGDWGEVEDEDSATVYGIAVDGLEKKYSLHAWETMHRKD